MNDTTTMINARPSATEATRRIDADMSLQVKIYRSSAQRMALFDQLRMIKNGKLDMGLAEVQLESDLLRVVNDYMKVNNGQTLAEYTGVRGSDLRIAADTATIAIEDKDDTKAEG